MKREIELALADPALRLGRARAARHRTAAEHLYDHRVAVITDWISRHQTVSVIVPARTDLSRNVLVVTHNLNGMQPGGGVEVYQEELPRMEGNFSFTFLVAAVSQGDYVLRVRRPNGSLFDRVLPAPLHPNSTHDAPCEAAFQRILLEHKIDLVHFQHLIGLPLSLPLIASACGIPTVWSVHDYYLVCKRFNLIDYSGRFCDIANRSKANCDVCLSATDDLPAGAQGRRMAFLSEVLARIDLFIVSTAYSGNYLRRIYPEIPAGKIRQIEMLMPTTVVVPAHAGPRDEVGPLRVAIPGNFTEGKGGHQLVRLMNLMRDRRIEFTILGYVHPDFAGILDALAIRNLTRRGTYRPQEAIRLLAEHDVSLHLSIWPETYMITLSEVWAAGLVPIVSCLGAPGERVRHDVDGFVVDPLDIGAVIELLDELIADRDRLKRMQDAVAQLKPASAKQHLDQLRTLYEELVARRPVAHTPFGQNVLSRQALSTFATGIRTNSPRWDNADNQWDKHWDGRPKSPTILADAIPSRYDRPQRLLAGITGLSAAGVTIDLCWVDGEPVPPGNLQAAREVRLIGWAFAPGQGAIEAAFVSLTNGQGGTIVQPVEHRARPDVAATLRDPNAELCGFKLELDLRLVPEGLYSVGIIHSYSKAVVTFPDAFSLVVYPVPASQSRKERRLEGPARHVRQEGVG